MNDNFEKAATEAAAFQKIWMETMTKVMQAAFTFTPNSPPPEVMRQIRGGIFQALAQSWEEFMRSPQFLEGMKQWMDNAIAFRKMTNDFLAKARTEMQTPSRADIDTVMLTVRHMEKRLLDRMEELSGQVAELSQRSGNPRGAERPAARSRRPRRTAGNGKGEAS
jgi:hypothetical protein